MSQTQLAPQGYPWAVPEPQLRLQLESPISLKKKGCEQLSVQYWSR